VGGVRFADPAPQLSLMNLKHQYRQFQSHYHETKHKVFSFVFYRVGQDTMLAEDLTSDIFLKAYERFESYNDDYAFTTWVYTIARNHLTDYFRKNKDVASNEIEISDERSTETMLKTNLDTLDSMARLRPLLAKLPSLQQECLILKYLDELETKEIAHITGESTANVRQALSRGLKKLRGQAHFLSFLLPLFLFLTTL